MAEHINKEFAVVYTPATKNVFLTTRSWQKIPWQNWDEDDLDEEYSYLAKRTYLFSICDRPIVIQEDEVKKINNYYVTSKETYAGTMLIVTSKLEERSPCEVIPFAKNAKRCLELLYGDNIPETFLKTIEENNKSLEESKKLIEESKQLAQAAKLKSNEAHALRRQYQKAYGAFLKNILNTCDK